jgi:biopolymer transport protein ExbB/TolQ
MKLKFGFFLALMIAGVIVANAQGGFRRTVEERVKSVHEKMDSAFKLDSEKQVKVDSAFANYYRQQDKIREEMRSGGERPDFQAMREKMQPAIEARDKELKTLLTDEQFKKWKEEIEPAMMQRRGGNRQ